MKPDSPVAPRAPSLGELFLSFLGVSILGFGGVMPWARWIAVERRNWLTAHEFLEAMALCQTLPGVNILNFAVIVGSRFHGVAGAIISVIALTTLPFALVLILASLYTVYGDVPGVQEALRGVSSVGAGLVAAMAIKMALHLRGEWVAITAAVAAFGTVGVFRVPLLVALAALAPLTILYAWRRMS